MTRLAPAVLAVAVAVAVAAAGCSGARPAATPGPAPPNPDRAALLARADLEPCPASTAAPVHGGLPNLTLPCLAPGRAVRLSGLRGVPTVVNIWGSWCGPCQAESRYLATVARAAGSRVRFLGVDTEDQSDSALDFVAHVQPPLRYPQVVDADKRLLIALNSPSAVPTTVFVDARGRVVYTTHVGYRSAAALRSDIRRHLGVAA